MPHDIALISPTYDACIVCGGKPVTETHIWPRWLRRAVPRFPNHDVVTDYAEPGFTGIRRRVSQKIKRDLFTSDPLLACSNCNGGWMKQFEDEVVRFLKPAFANTLKRSLTDAEQKSLSGWLTLITMLAEWSDYAHPTFGKEGLLHLRKHRVPPDDFHIYVAHGSGIRWRQWYRFHNFYFGNRLPPIAADGRPQHNAQITTMGISNLIAHVFSGPDTTVIQSYCIAMEGSGLHRIWPLQSSFWTGKNRPLEFPLKTKLSDREVDVLADAFHNRIAAESLLRS